jgi:hypothetical protein
MGEQGSDLVAYVKTEIKQMRLSSKVIYFASQLPMFLSPVIWVRNRRGREPDFMARKNKNKEK